MLMAEKRELTDRERTLRWATQGYPKEIPKHNDSAPEFGGSVQNTVRSHDLTRPITTQPELTPPENPLTPHRRVQTSKSHRPLQPKDQIVVEAAQGFQDPVTLKRAREQLFAIYGSPKKRKKINGRK